jgi:hypothetical protein
VLAIGNDELEKCFEVHKGEKIRCPNCGEWHVLEAGKNKDGKETEIILFYKCGDKVYLGAVANKLLVPKKTKETSKYPLRLKSRGFKPD